MGERSGGTTPEGLYHLSAGQLGGLSVSGRIHRQQLGIRHHLAVAVLGNFGYQPRYDFELDI